MSKACKRCGKCCQKAYFMHSSDEVLMNMQESLKLGNMESFKEWSIYFSIVGRKKLLADGFTWVWKCKMYNKKKSCTIYKNRPRMCKEYPYGREGKHKGCGYKGVKKNG